MKSDALSVTANSLAIVAQLLAIGIEVGVIVGGVCIYKKLTATEVVQIPQEPQNASEKKSWKEKWQKVKKIAKAVIEE